jgi:hypothetical protein
VDQSRDPLKPNTVHLARPDDQVALFAFIDWGILHDASWLRAQLNFFEHFTAYNAVRYSKILPGLLSEGLGRPGGSLLSKRHCA